MGDLVVGGHTVGDIAIRGCAVGDFLVNVFFAEKLGRLVIGCEAFLL